MTAEGTEIIFWARGLSWGRRNEGEVAAGRQKKGLEKTSIESWRKQRFHEALRDGDHGLTFFEEAGFSNIVQAGSHQKQTLEGVKKQKVFFYPSPSGSYPKGRQVMLETESSFGKYLRSSPSRS